MITSISATESTRNAQFFKLLDGDRREVSLSVIRCEDCTKLSASVRLARFEPTRIGYSLLKSLLHQIKRVTGTKLDCEDYAECFNTVKVTCYLEGLDSLESFTDKMMSILH